MKARVVYVDDEPHNLTALKRVFHHESIHFITFDSPAKALAKIDEIKPAVVISDYRMPVMNGIVFLEEVKKRQPDAVRIILTGHADLEMAILAINQDNVFRFIKKPWDDQVLKSQVAAALDYYAVISGLRGFKEKGIDENLIKKERMQAMQELAITIRQELDQSMAIITGYSQLLRAYLDRDPLLTTYITNIIKQISTMEALTTKITSITGCGTNAFIDSDRKK